MKLKLNQNTRIIILLILTGALLRFFRVNTLGTFLSDQAIELLDTLAIARGDLKLIGIKTSISQLRNGAVMYYLLLPFLILFNYHPIAGSFLQSLLSLATIPLAYLIGKKARNSFTGIMSAAVIALSPLLVEYSRQTMLAYYPLFFASLGFLLLLQLVEKFSTPKAILLGFILGFLIQVSYLTFTLIPLTIITVMIFAKKQSKRLFSSLGKGFVLGFSPMLLFEVTHKFFNTQMLLKYFQTAGSIPGRLWIVSYFPELFARLFAGGNTILGWFIFLGFIVILLTRFIHKDYSLPEKIALIHLFLTGLLLLLFKGAIWYHYALTAFIPLIILVVSSFLWISRQYSWTKLPLILLTFAMLITSWPAYRLFEDSGAHMSPGWSLTGVQRAAGIIIKDLNTDKFNVVMIVDAQNQGYPLRYFLEVAGKTPLGVAQYDQAENLYVIREPGFDLQAAQNSIYELGAFGKLNQANQWHIQNRYYLVKFVKN